MAKWNVFRQVRLKRVIEAETAEAAEVAAFEQGGTGIWTASEWEGEGVLFGTATPYEPPVLDWDAINALPKPAMTSGEVMEITRGAPENILFQLIYEDPDGNNKDLLVVAANPEQVFNLWGSYYFDTDWDDPVYRMECHFLSGDLLPVQTLGEDEGAELRIYQITVDLTKARAIEWASDDAKAVAYMRAH